MSEGLQTAAVIISGLTLMLAGLAYVVWEDPYLKREHRIIMLEVVLIVFTLILNDQIESVWNSRNAQLAPPDSVRTLLSIYSYCMRPVILVMVMGLLEWDWRPWLLAAANALIHLTASFSGVVFCFRNGHFVRGPLGYTCHVASLILILWDVCLSWKKFRHIRRCGSAFPLLIAISLIFATWVDTFALHRSEIPMLTLVIVGGCVFYYIWLHLQFAWEHEQALMAEQRIRIMITQIQPHFLYNTLSTIQSLCLSAPEQAAETTARFGLYLRHNLDTLNQTGLTPLEQELEHTKLYTEIEQLRFPSIEVRYHIEDRGVMIPPLTIQPLVENAIRHGVRGLEHGLVTVETRPEDGWHVISIRDNGTGFDVSAAKQADGTHIGLRNVRERIERQCGGTMEIDSAPGRGTTITLRVPAERKESAPAHRQKWPPWRGGRQDEGKGSRYENNLRRR